ncbi:MAG: AmmeMemoRadiSam system protein B [Methylocystis sp.]
MEPQGAIRPAAVAGLFYPANASQLRSNVKALLEHAGSPRAVTFAQNAAEAVAVEASPPKALIVPHAGYVYSGPVAGAAYRLLAKARGQITRVVLLGPSHRVAFAGMAATSASAYETPLGLVPIDQEWLSRARDLPLFRVLDEAHEGEHCLETQLPFLQVALGDFKLSPIVFGRVDSEAAADLLETLWGGPETLIVVSSDLSHYLDYEACRALDEKSRAAIERLDPSALGSEQACGAAPVHGLLTAAKRRGLRVRTLDLCNSGDTAGPRHRVVGYGAWAFFEEGAKIAPDDAEVVRLHGALMNDVARSAILGHRASHPPEALPPALKRMGASFVTLHKSGSLRGCCGSVTARRPLVEDIRANATRSAFRDPRFTPLQPTEWGQVSLTVTLLSPLEPMRFENEADLLSQLQPHRDGLLIEDAGRQAVFLPAVWEQLAGKEEFLAHLRAKAGLPRGHWSPHFCASRFITTQTIEEPLLPAV